MAEGVRTPVIKGNKQYGDATALNRLAIAGSGLSQSNADYVPRTRQGPGRPQGSPNKIAAPQAGGFAQQIPAEHIDMMKEFSIAARVAQIGEAAAMDATAGPWLRQYAELAQGQAQSKAERLRTQTPFFE